MDINFIVVLFLSLFVSIGFLIAGHNGAIVGYSIGCGIVLGSLD